MIRTESLGLYLDDPFVGHFRFFYRESRGARVRPTLYLAAPTHLKSSAPHRPRQSLKKSSVYFRENYFFFQIGTKTKGQSDF